MQAQNYSIAPKVIREIWLGSDLPIKYRIYFKEALELNPDYEGELWIDHSLITEDQYQSLVEFTQKNNIQLKEVWLDFFNKKTTNINNEEKYESGVEYTEEEQRIFADSMSGIDAQWCQAADIFRTLLLYNFGGIYLDTDNKVIGKLGDIQVDNYYGALFPPGLREL